MCPCDGRLVVVSGAHRHDLRFGRQFAHHLAERAAEVVRVANRDLEHLHAARPGRVDLGLDDHEREIQEQDRPGHAEGVGHRIAHRRVVVAQRRDGGLQRRRAGARTREQPEGVAQVHSHHLRDQQARRARHHHADQRDDVGPLAGPAGQADDELLAVLDPDRIEEERQAECPHHRRRHGLGCKPANGERDEQHGAHAEREALDIDLADEIADGDREEQRHQRLLLQQRLDPVHFRLLCFEFFWQTVRQART